MADNNRSNGNGSNGAVGLLLGSIFAIAAAIFILTGGQLGGVKEVNGDADLPPVTSPK